MLNRKIDSEIEKHFASTKKAMFLTGARQVGKTYAIRKYARQHDLRLVEMNFLLQPESITVLKGAGDIKDMMLRISAYTRESLVPGKTLIFFDEIQEYADIMTWVKALVDEGSYFYALSGSLLGVEMKNIRWDTCRNIRCSRWTSRSLSFPPDFHKMFLTHCGSPGKAGFRLMSSSIRR